MALVEAVYLYLPKHTNAVHNAWLPGSCYKGTQISHGMTTA